MTALQTITLRMQSRDVFSIAQGRLLDGNARVEVPLPQYALLYARTDKLLDLNNVIQEPLLAAFRIVQDL